MIEFPHKYKGGFSNNFDLIRLVLATSVVFLHFDHLVNDPAVSEVLRYTEFLSGRAVKAFFVVSGFVIYMSFDRTRNLKKYAISRVLRLYPAYLAVVLFVALLPFFLTSCEVSDIFSSTWWRYITVNLVFMNFLQDTLPCLFAENFDQALNGSLWTLKIEVMFYAVVPILFCAIRRFGGVKILTLTYVFSLIYSSVLLALAEGSDSTLYTVLAHQLPGQMTYFVVGIFLYLYHQRIAANWPFLVLVSLVLLVPQPSWVEPFALGVLVIAAATAFRYNVSLARLGDLSYGIYIFHFPIIQISLQLHLFEGSALGQFSVVLATTFIAAFLSSRLIEYPSAKLNNKFAGKHSPGI